MTMEQPDTTTAPARRKRNPALLIIGIAVALLVIAAGTIVGVTHFAGEQRKESLSLLKDDRLNALSDARAKVSPAVNAYLAAYKEARNAPASRADAEKASQKQRDEFRQASDAARAALQDVKSSHGSGEDPVGVALQQLVESHEGYFDYMEGLVDSYPLFEGLFREGDEAGCNGLFVGSKAASLRERQTLLAQAAGPCRKAAGDLKQSKNAAYVEFARTFDNRVAELEAHAEVTAKSEESYTEFVRIKDEFETKLDDAEARNASDEEYRKIADEAKAVNAQIRANRSEFDFAADRYLDRVREMPDLVGDVFSKNVAADIKHFDAVIPLRVQVLKDVVDTELVE